MQRLREPTGARDRRYFLDGLDMRNDYTSSSSVQAPCLIVVISTQSELLAESTTFHILECGLAWDADDGDHPPAALVVNDLYHIDEKLLGPRDMFGIL